MKQQRILTIAILCSTLIACTYTGSRPATANVNYVNARDIYSSDASLLERSMCGTEKIGAPVKLELLELRDLGDTAVESGFFNLPKFIDTNRHSDGSITMCGGCASYKLDISYLGKSNSVSWSCNCDGPDSTPKELAQVVGLLNGMLYQRDTVKALAPSKCHLY